MVDRHKRCVERQAVIVDLDETFIKVNTFNHYFKFLLRISFNKGFYSDTIELLIVAIKRKFRLISHSRAKQLILGIAKVITSNEDNARFADQILYQTNDDVANEIDWLQCHGHPIYLATAAPEIYAKHIAIKSMMDGCISTPIPNQDKDIIETRGEVKLKETIALLNLKREYIWRIYTDHYDDLPIMSEAKETVLVNPRKKTLSLLKKSAVNFRVINRHIIH